jgi:hypothetical protein
VTNGFRHERAPPVTIHHHRPSGRHTRSANTWRSSSRSNYLAPSITHVPSFMCDNA